jgi:hypothetical protein
MSYEIPIQDDTGVVVVRVAWSGTLYDGEARVEPIIDHEAIARHVADMILARQDLKSMRFRSEGDRYTVNGWQGYEGVVGALRISLPALGLSIGHVAGDTPPFGRDRSEEAKRNSIEGGIE